MVVGFYSSGQLSIATSKKLYTIYFAEGASLALFGHPSSDGITIKMPYGVDVLHQPDSHPIFSELGWLKLNLALLLDQLRLA